MSRGQKCDIKLIIILYRHKFTLTQTRSRRIFSAPCFYTMRIYNLKIYMMLKALFVFMYDIMY